MVVAFVVLSFFGTYAKWIPLQSTQFLYFIKKKKNIKSFISAHLVEFAQNLLIFSHIMIHSLIIQLSFSSVFILNCLVDSTPKISKICFILSIFDLFIIFLILFLGQSGGMDEELFTKSFEDVPKVQVGLSFLGK